MERLLRTLPRSTGTAGDTSGRVGIVGGSVDFPGQPTLAGMAALRTGANFSKALVSEEIHPIVAAHSPNLLAGRYPDERFDDDAADRAFDLGEWVDALVIGPGLVDADADAIERTVSGLDVPTVVDADAIEHVLGADLSNTVFTPNDEEEEGIEDEYGSIEAFTTETDAVVVSKGDVDVIVADGERSTNDTGTSALSVAGTGDTMTGIIAGLLVQGLDRADAAELGAWVVGKAGELATTETGTGVVATDVIDRIPEAIR